MEFGWDAVPCDGLSRISAYVSNSSVERPSASLEPFDENADHLSRKVGSKSPNLFEPVFSGLKAFCHKKEEVHTYYDYRVNEPECRVVQARA